MPASHSSEPALNGSSGPVHVVVPTAGFSRADAEGGDLWDPEADAAFVESLRDALRPDIPFEQVDAHVDDADFAELVADRYLTLEKVGAHTAEPGAFRRGAAHAG